MVIEEKKSYFILLLYSMLIVINQYFWISFTTITPEVVQFYHTTSYDVGILTIIFPIIYIIISFPAGIFIDKYGYKKSIMLGATIMTVFSILRLYNSFDVLFIGQIGIAVAQPFLLNSSTKLSHANFSESKAPLAIGISVVFIFVGIALGTIIPPLFVFNFSQYYLLTLYWILISIIMSILFFAFVYYHAPESHEKSNKINFTRIFTEKKVLIFYYVIFIGMGTFIGLLTWIDNIFMPIGYSELDIGLISFMFIIGSIIGSFIITYFSTKFNRFWILVTSFCLSSIVLLIITFIVNIDITITLMVVLGIFFSGSFPLIISWSSDLVGAEMSGSSTSAIWFFGNVGGIFIPLLMPYSFSVFGFNPYFIAFIVIAVALILAVPLIFLNGMKVDIQS